MKLGKYDLKAAVDAYDQMPAEALAIMSGDKQATETAIGLQIAKTAAFYLQDWALEIRTLAQMLGAKYVYQVDLHVGGVSAAVRLAQNTWLCYHTGVSRWRVVSSDERLGASWYAKPRQAAH